MHLINPSKKTKAIIRNYSLLLGFIGLLLLLNHCGHAPKSGLTTPCEQLSLYQGEKKDLSFFVNNQEAHDLKRTDHFFISYHLYDANRKLLRFDNRRFNLPVELIKRGRKVRVNIPVFFDHKPGKYLIEFDLVREGKFWGGQIGWDTSLIKLELMDLYSPDFRARFLSSFINTPYRPINREQYLLRLILKNSEIYKNRRLWGFSAGSGYPQVWIRDLSTMLRYALLYYPLQDLQKMLEMFLSLQRSNGEIVDWVDLNGHWDKNTVETDQESSLIIGVGELAGEDSRWLNTNHGGITVRQRILKALEWVWNHKRDPEYNLIYSGLTADWGDVEKSYPDQRAIKLSDRSRLVFSIYTQAMYIRGINSVLPFLNEVDRRLWEKRLRILKTQTKKVLYLEDKGYFIIHLDPKDNRYYDLEKGILPLGGNAEAIRAGLMNPDEIKRFVRVHLQRRERFNLRTVSFTLLPPYPKGFFPHPALKNEWSYQNGGEWDWIGGRYLSALFLSGFKDQAHRYLLEIIRKHLANYTIFEWEDRQGNGRGSFSYGGAAGVMGEAILLGYSKARTGGREPGNRLPGSLVLYSEGE